MQIDLARHRDAPIIATLSREHIEYGLDWRWTPRRISGCIRDTDVNVIVARPGGSGGVAGFGIMRYSDEEAHLLLLAVDATARRERIGSMLLGWLEMTVITAGIGLVHLEVREDNLPARAFYRKHGYATTGHLRGYYEGRENALSLRKDLWCHERAPPS